MKLPKLQIKHYRKISQIIFFILILFGGFIIAQIFNIIPDSYPRGTESEISLTNAHLPVRACRYIVPKPTLFESCGLRYLLDRPLYFSLDSWFPIALYILIILGLCFTFGRFMCGWFCPLGFISDLLDYIRKKLKLNKIKIPDKLKTILRYWRYSFLLFLVFLSITLILPFAGTLFMNKDYQSVACQVCPARTILPVFGGQMPIAPSFISPATIVFSSLSMIFLGIYLTGIIISRPWCRICPNGTFTSLFNRGALITKNKDVQKCTKCGICKRVCPFTNDHVFDEKKASYINHSNCIMCFTCVDKCPEDDCLNVKFAKFKIFKSKFKK